MSISVPKLSPFSSEFGYAEQQLRLKLNAPSLVVDEMVDISLRPVNVQFSNFVQSHQPMNVVDVFIPPNQMKQSKPDIANQGVKVHQRYGFTFNGRTIDIDLDDDTEVELIHIQVALGSVLNLQDKKAPLDKVKFLNMQPTVDMLTEGFHSFRVSENNYTVFSPNQIKALHVIKFRFIKGVSDAKPSLHECDMCHKRRAELYCYNDQKKFCKECDEQLHEQNEIMKSHKRVDLISGMLEVQKCPEHPDLNVTYYCTKCNLPICLDCKVKGSHAHGDAAKHRLIPIAQAYNEAIILANKVDPLFSKREESIRLGLEDCNRRLENVKKNQDEVENEIMRIAMKAIEDSRYKSATKANEIKSAINEYERKLEDCRKLKELTYLYRDEAEPVPFLQAITRKNLLQEEMIDNLDIPTPLKTKGDLIVYGRLEVNSPKKETLPQQPAERGIDDSQSTTTYSTNESTNSFLEPAKAKWTKLSKIAARKLSKYNSAGILLPFTPFSDSRIITSPSIGERLYLCLPFKGTPKPHILFSTELHSRNIKMMHKMIDEMGITLVLIKVGDQIFGGFAGTKWIPDGQPKKDKCSTFLFQINRDAFIPYAGQSEDPYYIKATPDSIQFGDGDIKIGGLQFEKCSSQIENSYGLGFVYGSPVTKEFMAGKHHFAPDIIEVWGFFQNE